MSGLVTTPDFIPVAHRRPGYAYTLKNGKAAIDYVATSDITIDKSRMSASGIFVSPRLDRQGDVIEMSGIRTENHRTNPVVLWDHGQGKGEEDQLPIGKTEDEYGQYTVTLTDEHGIAKTYFSQSLRRASQVFGLICEKILRAQSIGFDVIKTEPLYFERRRMGNHLREIEMVETSWTAIGANPDAVRSAMCKNWDGKPLDCGLLASLEPFAARLKAWAPGATLPSNSPDIPDGLPETEADRLEAMADIIGGLMTRPNAKAWLATVRKEFDESKVSRDHGKFASSPGGSGNAPKPKPAKTPKKTPSPRATPVPAAENTTATPAKPASSSPLAAAPSSPKDPSHWGSAKQPYWRPGKNPTVDNVITRDNPKTGQREVLLIQRAEMSHGKPVAEGGKWALPGGFHDSDSKKGEEWKPGKETPAEAALRELKEETGLDAAELKDKMRHVGEYEGNSRDPRDNAEAWSSSNAFHLHLTPEMAQRAVAGTDDASDAKWIPLGQLPTMAFDHAKILADAKVGAKTPRQSSAPRAGGKQVQAAAKAAVEKILTGAITADSHKQLLEHLPKLTVPQLREIAAAHNLKCPERLKGKVLAKLATHFNSKIIKAGSVDVAKVAATLAPFAKTKLDANETRFAQADYLTIQDQYGTLTGHRIKELAVDALQAMKDLPAGSAERQTFRKKLAGYAWMAGQAQGDGITGKVEPKDGSDFAAAVDRITLGERLREKHGNGATWSSFLIESIKNHFSIDTPSLTAEETELPNSEQGRILSDKRVQQAEKIWNELKNPTGSRFKGERLDAALRSLRADYGTMTQEQLQRVLPHLRERKDKLTPEVIAAASRGAKSWVRKSAEFDESKVNRDHGKFSSGPGAGAESKPESKPSGAESGGDKPKDAHADRIAAHAATMKEKHGDQAHQKVQDTIAAIKASGDPQAAAKIGVLEKVAEHLKGEKPSESKPETKPEAETAKPDEKPAGRRNSEPPNRHEQAQQARDKEDAEIQAERDAEDEEIEEKRGTIETRHEKELEKHQSKIDKVQEKRDAVSDKRDTFDEKRSTKRDSEDEKIGNRRDKEDEKITKTRDKEDAALAKERDKTLDGLRAIADKANDAWTDIDSDADPEGDAKAKAAYDAAEDAHTNAEGELDQKESELAESRDKEDTDLQAARDKEDEELAAARDKEDEELQAERDAEDAEFDAEEERLNDEQGEIEERHAEELAEFETDVVDAATDRRDEEDQSNQEERDAEDEKLVAQTDKEADEANEWLEALEGDDLAEHSKKIDEWNEQARKAGSAVRIEWLLGGGWGAVESDAFTDEKPPELGGKKSRSMKNVGQFDNSKHPRGQPGNPGQFGPGGGGGGGGGGDKTPASKPDAPSGGKPRQKPTRAAVLTRAARQDVKATMRGLAKVAGTATGAFTAVEHAVAARIKKTVLSLPRPLQIPVIGMWKAAMSTYTAGNAAVKAVAAERGNTPEQVERIAGICSTIDVCGAKGGPFSLGKIGAGGLVTGGIGFVPLGSVAYLAMSTARDPMATYRAAKKAVAGVMERGVGATAREIGREMITLKPDAHGHKSRDNEKARMDRILAVMLDMIKAAPDADVWAATFHAALDATNGDVIQALKVTRAATK
jgi:ADP-ribose pyrophosphatase YjhB (NUDIX family)